MMLQQQCGCGGSSMSLFILLQNRMGVRVEVLSPGKHKTTEKDENLGFSIFAPVARSCRRGGSSMSLQLN